MKTKFTASQVAKLFNVPVASVRAQYAANAAELRECEAKAKAKASGVYRGATAGQWREFAKHAESNS